MALEIRGSVVADEANHQRIRDFRPLSRTDLDDSSRNAWLLLFLRRLRDDEGVAVETRTEPRRYRVAEDNGGGCRGWNRLVARYLPCRCRQKQNPSNYLCPLYLDAGRLGCSQVPSIFHGLYGYKSFTG
jgi:AAA+ ATPase superfamily predicted ATPase